MANASDDEPFFQRWSRRKQQSRTQPSDAPADPAAASLADPAALRHEDAGQPENSEPNKPADAARAKRPLTEDDFKDVEWDKLDYASDYGRFLQSGVPEAIRQKALSKLWMSDTIFTQVDPFQDYAGDFTDAATVPKKMLKTAYRVGQGFLSDEEAQEWDALGKQAVPDDIAALPVLMPGFRFRRATSADSETLLALRRAAILGSGAMSYGPEIAESWASGSTASELADAIAAGAVCEVAVDDRGGGVVGFCSHHGGRITAVFVKPGFNRRGIASALLQRAEAAMAAAGLGHAEVQATLPARALLSRLGYRERGEHQAPTHGGSEMTVIAMSRWLISGQDVSIDAETPDQPDVAAFFAASEAYMGTLYPAESNHFAPVATLLGPNVLFLVARAKGRAIGCGAIVKADDGTAELKRMWVDPDARGLKIGASLLDALEAAARDDAITVLRLETGISQPEAISLYRRAGFVEIAPFADYKPDPLSLFMEKALRPR